MDSSPIMTEPASTHGQGDSNDPHGRRPRPRPRAGLRVGQPGVAVGRAIVLPSGGEFIAELLAFSPGPRAQGDLLRGCAVLATAVSPERTGPYSGPGPALLCAKSPDGAVEDLARAILVPPFGMPRWTPDMRCVRSRDALALPATDLAAATALLDARFMTGDRASADRFLPATRHEWPKPRLTALWRACARSSTAAIALRDTIFMLEPD